MGTETLFTEPAARVIELDIQGMTCASCVGRVERKLGRIEGVQAEVNLPLESARVTVPASITDQQIIDTVIATGYSASLRHTAVRPADDTAAQPDQGGRVSGEEGTAGTGKDSRAAAAARLLPRLVTAAVLTVPVVIISMVPGAQFPHWGWWAFALTLPVVTWAAWPFHRAAAVNARHLSPPWTRWSPSGLPRPSCTAPGNWSPTR